MRIFQTTQAVGFLAAAAVIFLLLAATPTCAQTDFSGLPIKPGDMVWITPPAGPTFGGTLTAVTATTLSVDGRDVRFEPGLKIAREGDSLLNGILIGAAIGVPAGLTVGAEACLDSERWKCAVGGSVTWGAIGAFVDWLRKGRTLIFEAPAATTPGARLVPSIAPGRKALSVVLSF